MEQAFPVLFHQYALHEGSGGAGRMRGGFGLEYEVEVRRGQAQASFMDHGRVGPQGALGGKEGGKIKLLSGETALLIHQIISPKNKILR